MPVISALPGLMLRGVNEAAGTITFAGPLGTNEYTFRVGDCEAIFGVAHGRLYTVTQPAGHPICLHRLIALGTLLNDAADADASRPLFVFDTQELVVCCLRDATSAAALGEYGWALVDPATTPYSHAMSGGQHGAEVNTDSAELLAHLRQRYEEYSAELEGPRFGGNTAAYTFLCADLYLRDNYGVSHGECVAFATIAAPRAEIVGEAMGCMWVRIDGVLRPLPGADTERALVMLYGMSDAAPPPAPGAATRGGVRMGALDSPRRAVRATSPAVGARARATTGPTGSRAAGAATVATILVPPSPYTAGKQTADGLPAVECQCPLGVKILAVASAAELQRQFQVSPNQMLTCVGGPDAGRTARVLGINRGNLVVHVADAAKCTVLRNCADGAELRQRFSVDYSAAAPFKAGVPRLRLGALDAVTSAGGKSPDSTAEPVKNTSFFGKLVASLTPRGTSSSAVPAAQKSVDAAFATLATSGPSGPNPPRSPGGSGGDDFWYWTVHGRAQFDVSPAACLHFGFHHGDSLRFTRGAEAGNVFHVLGVKAGALFVVPDVANSGGRTASTSSGLESPRGPGAVRRCAVPIRHCHDKAQLKMCVEPVRIGRVALESQAATSRPPLTPLSSPRVADKTPVLSPSLARSRGHSGASVGGVAHSSASASSHLRETLQLPVGPSATASSAAGTASATHATNSSSDLKSPMHMRLRSADTDSLVNDSFTTPTAYPAAPVNSPATQAAAEADAPVARDILASPYQAPAMLRARGLSGASAISNVVHADPSTATGAAGPGAQTPGGLLAVSADGGSASSGGTGTPVITVTPAAATTAPAPMRIPQAVNVDAPALAPTAYAPSASETAAVALGKLARLRDSDRKRRTEPRPFPVGVMPATRHYLKAVALHALGLRREAEAPAAFYDFYAVDPTQRLSIAVESLPHFVEYWDLHQDALGLPAFEAAETDEMVPLMSRMDADHQHQQ